MVIVKLSCELDQLALEHLAPFIELCLAEMSLPPLLYSEVNHEAVLLIVDDPGLFEPCVGVKVLASDLQELLESFLIELFPIGLFN
jgi:hypothetical protein